MMQVTVNIACECGMQMEAHLQNRWVCSGCKKVFQSQIPVNTNNGQLRPDQVESILWFLETIHQEKPADPVDDWEPEFTEIDWNGA
jgi:hypothetical protein